MKILVLTSVYPSPDDRNTSFVTPVVHYFAKEWVKFGHEVLVINNKNKYPLVAHLIPSRIKNIILTKYDINFPTVSQRKKIHYVMDNVMIYRIPILKMIPWGKYLNWQLQVQYNRIKKLIRKEEFYPDIVVGHWDNPQLPLLAMIKKEYRVKTVLAIHGTTYLEKYRDWVNKYIPYIDIMGYRSKAIQTEAEKILGKVKKSFICYSGISDSYVKNITLETKERFSSTDLTKYIYVGKLIERKYVDRIILALSQLSKDKMLKIVGIGQQKEYLEKLCIETNMCKEVRFLGKQKREDVIRLMQNSECFIMISKDEAFGLVYLEAMLQGCIVVASRDEGIDGIIVHGENGFLCKAGDVNELRDILNYIDMLSIEEKEQISRNAIKTALNYTDSKVAEHYLKNIF